MQGKNISNAIRLLSLSLAALATCVGRAETPADGTGPFGAYAASKEWTPPNDPAVLKKLQEWQNQKLGLLITWGTYSQWGIVESWSLTTTRFPWNKRPEQFAQLDNRAYAKVYENLIATFKPTKFNPDKWAAAFKDAGVKYVLPMAKHHDGFCMWNTATTDYKITSPQCPFHTDRQADTIKEMSMPSVGKACVPASTSPRPTGTARTSGCRNSVPVTIKAQTTTPASIPRSGRSSRNSPGNKSMN